MKKVAVIMGSKSDVPTVKDAYDVLKEFGVPVEAFVMSAHRSPESVAKFADEAEGKGYGVIIAAAGKAAHLAGVIAGHTPLPVIGIPVKSSFMDGLDSLLSTVQMPAGVPVATVAVNGAKNAGLLAIQMLSLHEEGLMNKLKEFKRNMAEKIEADNRSFTIE